MKFLTTILLVEFLLNLSLILSLSNIFASVPSHNWWYFD